MKKFQGIVYDFVFIGLGTSNSLILLSLIQKGLLKNKLVAIFEAGSNSNDDKTFCFWSGQNEPIVADLAPIIANCFNTIKVNQLTLQNIDAQPYHCIRSIDLFNYTLQTLTRELIKIYRIGANHITCEEEIYTIHTNRGNFQANYVFDSRPPSPDKIRKKQINLNQSFYGLHIKCENDVFQKNAFEMMNFSVDQNVGTQFVNMIPFSSNEALLELTRFGGDKIDVNLTLGILDKFISRAFGKYEILAEELGCIPMTTFINPSNSIKGILYTDASASLIKPSTGYGFKNMYAFAQLVTRRIESNKLENFNKIELDSKKRFKFYNKLLLMILLYWPSKGKLIFTSLFKKQSVLTIFSFLDEKPSLRQEFKVCASLPILPFLKAFYIYLKNKNYLRYICAFLIVVTYLVLSKWSHQFAAYFSTAVLITGLLWIGIPHGALDHLLSKNKSTPLFLFIFKYLLIIALYYVFWQYFSLLALLVFILYSSFHFGESELVETDKKVDSLGAKFKAFLMGLSILFFIIFSHTEETLAIVSKFMDISVLGYHNWNSTVIALSGAILTFIYILMQSIMSKRWSYLGVLFLLLLSVKVPLILAFGLYFIFQHSSNAWQHLKLGLNMNSIQLYKKSSFYTLGALIIFLLIAFSGDEIDSMDGMWAKFFIFIACTSFPHFLFMHVFYKAKNR